MGLILTEGLGAKMLPPTGGYVITGGPHLYPRPTMGGICGPNYS